MGLTFDNMLIILEITNILDVSEHSSFRPTPILSINRAYFDFLVQLANAKHDTNIPTHLRDEWIKLKK